MCVMQTEEMNYKVLEGPVRPASPPSGLSASLSTEECKQAHLRGYRGKCYQGILEIAHTEGNEAEGGL